MSGVISVNLCEFDVRIMIHTVGYCNSLQTDRIGKTNMISFPSCRGSRDGAVVRALASHQCGPGSIPGLGVICGLSLLLVLVLAPRGFSPGTPVFPSPQKPTFLNSNSIWKVSPISAVRAKYI